MAHIYLQGRMEPWGQEAPHTDRPTPDRRGYAGRVGNRYWSTRDGVGPIPTSIEEDPRRPEVHMIINVQDDMWLAQAVGPSAEPFAPAMQSPCIVERGEHAAASTALLVA